MTPSKILVMTQEEIEAVNKQIILKERARELARTNHEVQAEESLDVVVFLLAHEQYAVEMSSVVEVYPLKELTPLPCTPGFVRGVINVRGQIIAVIDIKEFFNLRSDTLTDLNKVIILEGGDVRLAMLADEVLGVREIAITSLQPSLPTLGGIGAEYLKGVTNERLMVLDAGRILTDERIVVNEEVASQ